MLPHINDGATDHAVTYVTTELLVYLVLERSDTETFLDESKELTHVLNQSLGLVTAVDFGANNHHALGIVSGLNRTRLSNHSVRSGRSS